MVCTVDTTAGGDCIALMPRSAREKNFQAPAGDILGAHRSPLRLTALLPSPRVQFGRPLQRINTLRPPTGNRCHGAQRGNLLVREAILLRLPTTKVRFQQAFNTWERAQLLRVLQCDSRNVVLLGLPKIETPMQP